MRVRIAALLMAACATASCATARAPSALLPASSRPIVVCLYDTVRRQPGILSASVAVQRQLNGQGQTLRVWPVVNYVFADNPGTGSGGFSVQGPGADGHYYFSANNMNSADDPYFIIAPRLQAACNAEPGFQDQAVSYAVPLPPPDPVDMGALAK